MRILVVDDAAFMRAVIRGNIEKMGHEIVGEACNGREALDKYKELKPDLVTMDITMPEVSGLEGLRMIKEFDRNAKVIVCSAMGQQGMVMDAIKAGALDFIVKPFNEARIIEALNRVQQA